MADPLLLAEVVDTLVDMDLVDLDGDGPWPGEPDDADAYEPDWSSIHPNSRGTDAPVDSASGATSVFDALRNRAGGGFIIPPPDVLDALAWYTPIHYFGLGSAIYIRESAVMDVTEAIFNRLSPFDRENPDNATAASRAAMSVLYLHEAYHHKIESLAIRYEMIERTRRYLPYSERVVGPLIRQGSDSVLEETLACAEMYRRFKTEKLYSYGITRLVRKATLEMLVDWFPTLPPSYKVAGDYLSDRVFDASQRELMSQVHAASVKPARNHNEWNLAPHVTRGLFDCKRITHVLVPIGQTPVLPWIGQSRPLPSISTREMLRRLKTLGWNVTPGRGKGSHIRLDSPGKPSLTLPANRESLSPVVLKSVADALGIRVADLALV
ncbi:hypothetical protein A5630_04570 [Mycolicibacterium mucogenicum]|uniref:Uncharacterized protein n=1 Tax=Mycolicibacterium mucogenicum TaxID=56689 RepID=A0A1A3GN04_MYCMU|nr:type II toxin-antitoxin system HicA family toxin [Mycolicibacterium mucogenicum]OBJ37417.1 hypothetical protein A5630_04570 [Mycolicibacterium mucogenicum]